MTNIDASGEKQSKFRNSDPWPRPRHRWPIIPDEHGRCWHAVQSDAKHAVGACEAIKKFGYECYYPQMRQMKPPALRNVTLNKRRKLADIGRPVLTPLFPGYPLVLFSLRDGQWHDLFDLFGIYGMKVEAGLPAPIPREVVENIKASEVGGAIPLETPVMKLLFALGEEVRIEEGPFIGFTGTVQELDESRRMVLLDVLMFNAVRKIPFEVENLSKL